MGQSLKIFYQNIVARTIIDKTIFITHIDPSGDISKNFALSTGKLSVIDACEDAFAKSYRLSPAQLSDLDSFAEYLEAFEYDMELIQMAWEKEFIPN